MNGSYRDGNCSRVRAGPAAATTPKDKSGADDQNANDVRIIQIKVRIVRNAAHLLP